MTRAFAFSAKSSPLPPHAARLNPRPMSGILRAATFPARRRFFPRITPSQWVIVSMIVGISVGYLFPDHPAGVTGFQASDLALLSSLFLRMIKLLIVPLLFATLVVGIAGHGDDLRGMGRLAVRAAIYFEVVTTLAAIVGLAAVNLARPGDGVIISLVHADVTEDIASVRPTFSAVVEHIVPTSFLKAGADNEVLQVVFFTVVFAIALTRVKGPAKALVLSLCDALSEVMFRFVGIVMLFAPLGIGAAIAVTVGHGGIGVLRQLGALVLTLYGSLVVFALIVLLPVALLARVPIRRFVSAVREPWLVAFTTSSSEAALPLAMERMEELGVPRRVVSFILPTGYTFNMDGTALYLALASVFVAQAAGIEMPLSQQFMMILTLMVTSKGVAGVPRASLVILSGALLQFGLPVQGVAVILGVDAVMDMARTSLNLLGNCLATVVMARWEGTFQLSRQD